MNLIFDIQNAWHKSYHIAKHIYKEKLNVDLLTQKFLIDFGYTCRLFEKYNKLEKIACCFDAANNYRKELYTEYKGNREKNKEQFFYDGINKLYDFLKEQGFIVLKNDGLEADDQIGLAIKEWNEVSVIVSNDEDIRMLLNDITVVYNNQSHDKRMYFTEKQDFENNDLFLIDIKLGINSYYENPNFILFKKMLLGCEGDNVPRILRPRIGEKKLKPIFNNANFSNYKYDKTRLEIISQLIEHLVDDKESILSKINKNLSMVDLCQSYLYIPSAIRNNALKVIKTSKFTYSGNYQFI